MALLRPTEIPRMVRSLDLLPKTLISGLLDGKAKVELLDCSPGLYPETSTPEFAILRAARISTGNPVLKSPSADAGLIRYLYENHHSSPFEQISLTYKLRIPIFVARQIFRHRTAKVNEESQRYGEIGSEFFNPLEYQIRGNLARNRQVSVEIELTEELKAILTEQEALCIRQFELYHQALKAGLAREIARVYNPVGTYTTIIFQMDLRNLLHFFDLRIHDDAQRECRDIAEAMLELIEPLFPVTISTWKQMKQQVSLTKKELDYLQGKGQLDEKEKSKLDSKINKL